MRNRIYLGGSLILISSILALWFVSRSRIGLHGDESWFGLRAIEYLEGNVSLPYGMRPYSGILQNLLNAIVFHFFGVGIDQMRLPSVCINVVALLLFSWSIFKRFGSAPAFVFLLLMAHSAVYLLFPKIGWEVCSLNLILLFMVLLSLDNARRDEGGVPRKWVFMFLFFSLLGTYNHVLFATVPLAAWTGMALWHIKAQRPAGNLLAMLTLFVLMFALYCGYVLWAIKPIWDAFGAVCFIPPLLVVILLTVYARPLMKYTSTVLQRSLNWISPKLVAFFLLVFILVFAVLHLYSFAQIMFQRVVFLRIFSYDIPMWSEIVLLITGGMLFIMLVWMVYRDLVERHPAGFIMICHIGLFALFTRKFSSIRYYLLVIAISFLYIAWKYTSSHAGVRKLLIGTVMVAAVVVQLQLWTIYTTDPAPVVARRFQLGIRLRETTAHFLPFDPVIQFMRQHRAGVLRTREEFIDNNYKFSLHMYPDLRQFQDSVSVEYDYQHPGDGFKKELIRKEK